MQLLLAGFIRMDSIEQSSKLLESLGIRDLLHQFVSKPPLTWIFYRLNDGDFAASRNINIEDEAYFLSN